MRILTLRLKAFGAFTDSSLDLSGEPGTVHVIHGANEAGKTTALAAIRQALYGLESGHDFLHDPRKIQIGATLLAGDGARITFVRQGGRRKLVDEAGEPLARDALLPFLEEVGPSVFDEMFGIAQESLVSGGRAIVEGRGEVSRTLFVAGGNVADLTTVLTGLDAAIDDLFQPRATRRGGRLNTTIRNLKERRDEQLALTCTKEAWDELQRIHAEALREAERLGRELEESRLAIRHLESLHRSSGPAQTHRKLQADLARLGGVRALASDFARRLAAARARCDDALARLDEIDRALARHERNLEGLPPPDAILEHEAACQALLREAGGHARAVEKRAQLRTLRASAEAQADGLARDLGAPLDRAAIDQLRVDASGRRALGRLVKEFRERAGAVEGLERQRVELAAAIEATGRRLAELGSLPDTAGISGLVEHVEGAAGGLDGRIDQRRVSLERLRSAIETARQRLNPAPAADAATLAGLPVPGLEVIAVHQERLSALGAREAKLADQAAEVASEREVLEARRAELERDGPVPTEGDVIASRELRREGWNLVRGAWLGPAPDPAGVDRYVGRLGGGDLARAYECAVGTADEVADRVRADAERVVEMARVVDSKALLDSRARRLAESLTQSRGELEAARKDWKRLWAACGVEPFDPASMQGWSRSHAELSRLVLELANEQRQLETDSALRTSLVARLREALPSPGDTPAGESLDEILRKTRAYLNRSHALEQERTRHRALLDERRANLESCQAELARHEAAAGAWTDRWARELAQARLPGDSEPDGVETALELRAQLFEKVDESRRLASQITELDRQIAPFDDQVRSVAGRVAPDLAQLETAEIVTHLEGRLVRARKVASRREGEEQAIREARQTRTGWADELAKAREELEALRCEAGCERVDDLARAAAASGELAQVRDRFEATRAVLAAEAGATPVERFAGQALERSRTELEVEIAAKRAILELRQRESDEAQRRLGVHRKALGDVGSSERVAELEEECQRLIAHGASQAEEFVRLTLMKELARQAAEKYRGESEGWIVERASRHFSRMTDGSFEGLVVEVLETERRLVGVRPGGGRLEPDEMSTGSVDQLYLSLRLAALEFILQGGRSFPFIVDDVLVQFDDRRAAAALRILAEVAEKAQVLVFTHHDHLVELAGRTLGTRAAIRSL